ncbi:hypothetical protein [Jeotgalibaca caeni]|nr:hypothetical protein [Jeotgalibaca caeni]MDE1550023.1 hypothetical protein [Jeotgalibaca caeni]
MSKDEKNPNQTFKQDKKNYEDRTTKLNVPKKGKRTPPGQKK